MGEPDIHEKVSHKVDINQKSAFIAIVGRPNVGKSSLLNRLLGEKVAIVTPKPQTTRTSITGVLTEGDTQLVFSDTPGMHKAKTALSRYMVKKVGESVSGAELAILMTEVTRHDELAPAELELIESFKKQGLPAIAVVNKIDVLKSKEAMMPLMARLAAAYDFDAIIPISVRTGEGVEELKKAIMGYAQPGPHFFPDDEYTDQPERVICAELIREKALLCLSEELPHGMAVTIEEMKERESGDIIDVQAVLFCEKESHKGMIIGKKGEMLKRIGSLARVDMEELLGCRVNLQCWVKVKEDWRNQERFLRNFGFND